MRGAIGSSSVIARVALSCVALWTSACADEGSSAATIARARATQAERCPHGVDEALCPKCRPALEAVYRAKGDWCAEHGFAESFCPICHPERAGKAAVVVDEDEPPADGTKVRFRHSDVARMAGIETARAEEDRGASFVNAVVRIHYDGTRVAHATAPLAGVVKKLFVDVGARVARGARIAVIDSVGVGVDRTDLIAAIARSKAAEANLVRERELHAKGVSPLRDVERAESERDAANAAVQAARLALGVVGASESGEAGFTLTAPLAGVVTRLSVSVGQAISAGAPIVEVVDASAVWADLDVPERDVARVRAGQEVELTVDALGERTFTGVISFVAPEIDPHTRTAIARVALKNDDGALLANMFGRARVGVEAARATVTVPREAVQRVLGQAFVFVHIDDESFEARRVVVEREVGGHVHIASGLESGAMVATTGAFLLKTELTKGAIGAGCCE